MTPADLPATARLDEGLIALVVLVLLVGAGIASVVYAARVQRRKDLTLTPEQVDRSASIAEARRRDAEAPPWPWHELTWDELYRADAEGEVVP